MIETCRIPKPCWSDVAITPLAIALLFCLLIGPDAWGAEEPAPPVVKQTATTGADEKPTGDKTAYGATPNSFVPYQRSQSPYRYFFRTPLLYRGSSHIEVDPSSLDSIPIGLMAPLKSESGKQMTRGMQLAIENANATGGFRDTPFRMVPKNDSALWGSAANSLVDLVEREKVWTVIGSTDSTTTHVAIRVALKLDIPIINIGGTDPTLTETGIPWVTRITIDDRQNSYHLASLLFEKMKLSKVAVLRSADRDGRFGVVEFRDAATRLGKPISMELQFVPGKTNFLPQMQRLKRSDAEAIVLWADVDNAPVLLKAIRGMGMRQVIVGTDRMVSPRLLKEAGSAAEGLILTSPMDPNRQDPPWLRFRDQYARAYKEEPGMLAAFAYDSANMAMDAIRKAGLNRTGIRDVLTSIRLYEGLSGKIILDETSNSITKPLFVRVEKGRFVLLD